MKSVPVKSVSTWISTANPNCSRRFFAGKQDTTSVSCCVIKQLCMFSVGLTLTTAGSKLLKATGVFSKYSPMALVLILTTQTAIFLLHRRCLLEPLIQFILTSPNWQVWPRNYFPVHLWIILCHLPFNVTRPSLHLRHISFWLNTNRNQEEVPVTNKVSSQFTGDSLVINLKRPKLLLLKAWLPGCWVKTLLVRQRPFSSSFCEPCWTCFYKLLTFELLILTWIENKSNWDILKHLKTSRETCITNTHDLRAEKALRRLLIRTNYVTSRQWVLPVSQGQLATRKARLQNWKFNRESRSVTSSLGVFFVISASSILKATTAQEVFGSGESSLRFMKHESINLTCQYKNFEDPLKVIWKWEANSKVSAGLANPEGTLSTLGRPEPLLFYQTRTLPDGTKTVVNRRDQVELNRRTVLEFDVDCDSSVRACPAHLSVLDGAPVFSGYYSCEVSDMRGSATAAYDVDILDQAPPEDVQLKMLTATSTYYPGGSRSTQVVVSGEELTLECSSDGFPSPMIKFLLDGNDIELGWVTLKDDTRTSEGKYLKRTIRITDIDLSKPELTWQCQANNGKGYDVSEELKVSYQYKPTIIQSLQAEKRVRINSEVRIMCEVKPGNPADTKVYWAQGSDGYGNEVSTGPLLQWSSSIVDAGKTGYYTCVAANAIGRSTFTIHIIIEYPPIVKISPQTMSVEEDGELALVCDIDAEPKEVQIQWRHESLANISGNQNVLRIPKVTKNHGGRYTCTVKNEHGSASKSATVQVLYRPMLNFEVEPNNVAFLEGDSVRISCSARSDPNPTELSIIKKDASSVPESAEKREGNQKRSYEITSLTKEHSGRYQCSAKNTVGRSTEELEISVQYAPVISNMAPQTIDEGQTLRLRCDVQGNPTPEVAWFSPQKNAIAVGKDLVLQTVSQSDAGVYLCKAKNKFHNDKEAAASMEVKVFVKFPPQYLPCSPKNLDGVFSTLPGQNAKLCCQFVLYPASQTKRVQWFKNSRENGDEISQSLVQTSEVEGGSEYQLKLRSELSLREVGESDFGDYFCAVKNEKGEQFKKIRLNKLRSPDAPSIQDVKPEAGALRVSWNPVSYMTSKSSWYEVGYKQSGSAKYQTIKAGNNNEVLISSLKPQQKYDVSVKACNSVGCSNFPPPTQSMPESVNSGNKLSSGSGSDNVPVKTMVIVPLVLVGLVLLISLLIVICRRNRDRQRSSALKKGIPAHPEELEGLKQSHIPGGIGVQGASGTLNSTISSGGLNITNEMMSADSKLDHTYVDYSMGPPGSTSYQILTPSVVGKSAAGIPICNVNGGERQPNNGNPYSVINLSASLDKASFNKLRGEPEGKERVRFADADGNTLYPGDVEPPTSGHHHTLTNGKLPHQNGGPNYNPGAGGGPRYSTLPHKLTAGGGSSGSPQLLGMSGAGSSHISSSTSAPTSVQDHIYSASSTRAKPAPLPRAPGTNLSQSQLSNSSNSSVTSSKSPPPSLPPVAANGPILKKSSAVRNSESTSPPMTSSVEGDHKTLTLKCPSGYSITSV